MSQNNDCYIGFDVGTGSARAAILDTTGKILADATEVTTTWRSEDNHNIFEQSTTEIWNCLAKCSQRVLAASGVKPEQVKGVSFDATCSLAVVDAKGEPVCVTEGEALGGPGERNVILWADHRAEEEAAFINKTGEAVLGFVGGVMSLEMEIPKTLWLKKHMKHEDFERSYFFDLPDYLTYRATDSPARSNCSLTCKFSYLAPGTPMKNSEGVESTSTGWSNSFLSKIGLESLAHREFEQVGGTPGKNGLVMTAGQPVGKGLTQRAAEELGLLPGTPVGSAVIDAYAGWVGTIAARSNIDPTPAKAKQEDGTYRLAACAGTSTCYIVQSRKGVFVDGVWGPYPHAVFPDWWYNEGGQSSTGQLIDFITTSHVAWPKVVALAQKKNQSTFEVLDDILQEMRESKGVETTTELTKHLHFYPDFHGNRSPLADVKMKGMITGLTLDSSVQDLARKFHVTLEGLAFQTRHILDDMNRKGHHIDSIYMSGSQAKNKRLMRLLATICGVNVMIPPHPSAAVVMGSAMMGKCAANILAKRQGAPIMTQEDEEASGKELNSELWDVMAEMTPDAHAIVPEGSEFEKRLLEAKYKIYKESISIQLKWRDEIDAIQK